VGRVDSHSLLGSSEGGLPIARLLSLQRIARRVTRRSQRAIAEVNVSIQEAVTGISVAKNFHREQGIYDEFLAVNRQSYDIHVKRGLVLAMLFPTLQFFSGLGRAECQCKCSSGCSGKRLKIAHGMSPGYFLI
jgi:ABC-type multidrug transport system fused ATPase/permease subunit